MNYLSSGVALLAGAVLAACGGGGGGSTNTSTATTIDTTSCGAASGATGSDTNVLPVTVKSCGVVATGNMPYVDVKVCAPGSTTDCKTVGYVLVDTGSYGLRLFASALGSSPPALTAETDGAGALYECEVFVSGYTWGSVKLADVTLGGITISSLPIQVVNDPAAPSVPSGCSGTGSGMTVTNSGVNGILGVGPFVADGGYYFTCTGSTGSSCSLATLSTSTLRVSNPVARIAATSDNNGVILDMPSVGASGAATATGFLILGIDTRSNNTFGSPTVLDIDGFANIRTTYAGSTISAFIDSGSNGLFFNDATIDGRSFACSGFDDSWYKPATVQSRSATVLGAANSNSAVISFTIRNATTLFNTGNTAFNNLGAPWDCATSEFDWGMPFFYGRRVFYAIDGRSTPAGTGPFVAF